VIFTYNIYKMNRKQIAFTLIELLVVIAIIGILSGLIVVTMNGVTQKANIAKGQVFSNSLRNALMLNLIAEYKLDSNANDAWGAHTAGTISGAASYSSCPQNTCYSFDGADDYIELPDSSDLRMSTGGTISAWIYPKSLGENNYGRIVDKSTDTSGTNGYILSVGINNILYFYFVATGSSELRSIDNVISLNQWQLATVTFGTSGRKLYVNGVDVTSGGGTSIVLPSNIAGVIAIGNRASNTDRSFDGYIDEIRAYNAVIPTSQIKEQYYAGLNNLLLNGSITKEEYSKRISEVAKN